MNESTPSVQVPPLAHGSGLHPLMSAHGGGHVVAVILRADVVIASSLKGRRHREHVAALVMIVFPVLIIR